jgi:NAD(P)-dependent dehydrogenase (short-subunit alcohol dehydrogenase family)
MNELGTEAKETSDGEERIALVTGSTDGIGRESALGLARQGATVLVHGRDREKGQALTDRIERETDGSAVLLLADFADREAITELAGTIAARYDRLDVLVHNAGATFQERGETDAGIERTFAINHLAPFLLTHRLLPLLEASAHARIITTSSGLHRRATIDFENLGMEGGYDGLEAYGRSKLANVLFTYELARRLDPASITANAFGPGFVPGTGLSRGASRWFRLATGALGRLPDSLLGALPGPAKSIEEGARTPIYLASGPEVKYVSGQYFESCSPVLSAPQSYDPGTARRLWEVSAEMVDLSVTDRSIERQENSSTRLLDRATRALGRF